MLVPTRCTATRICAVYFMKGPPQYPMTSWYCVALRRFPSASYHVPARHTRWALAMKASSTFDASLCLALLDANGDVPSCSQQARMALREGLWRCFVLHGRSPCLIDLAFISRYRAANRNIVLRSSSL